MLPKDKRLNLKQDFKWISSGQKVETKFAKLFIKMGDNILPRVGIATSSKVFKKATTRNRARRLISKSFEALYPNFSAGLNIVALPKRGVSNVKSEEILSDLETILKNEKIIS